MIERIVFMQVEDNMVTFEKENGDTIIYPKYLVPEHYKEGDIINAIVYDEEYIEFFEIDLEEMERRRKLLRDKKIKLRKRAKRSTNKY